ncbi:hypothetical protein J132_10677 [Termitomyces sp. J132]|nr:hypothetical protein J132_10677 [Termitomyces sp. J132]
MHDTIYSLLDLADGAKIAYEILGTQHLGSRQPLVLIGGMSSRRNDWERLANSLSRVRPRVISQQLLFLPHHPTRSVNLPFRVTHVLLAGTLCSTLKDPRYGLRINKNVPDSLDDKREMARGTLESTFDPAWLANPENFERFQWWLERMISGGR